MEQDIIKLLGVQIANLTIANAALQAQLEAVTKRCAEAEAQIPTDAPEEPTDAPG